MTVAGEFKGATVQRREADTNHPAQLFNAQLIAAKEKKSTLTNVVEGLGQGIELSKGLYDIQQAELTARQTELNIEKTKLANEALIEQKKEERAGLAVLEMDNGPEKLSAISDLSRTMSPKALQNIAPSIKAELSKMRNSSPQMAQMIKAGGLEDIYFADEVQARREQENKLAQITATGEQSRQTALFKKTQGISGDGGISEYQQAQLARQKKEDKQKAVNSVYKPADDLLEQSKPSGARTTPQRKKEANAKLRIEAIQAQLEAGKQAIESLSEQAAGEPFTFKGKVYTDPKRAHTEHINRTLRQANIPTVVDPYGLRGSGRKAPTDLGGRTDPQEALEVTAVPEAVTQPTPGPTPAPAQLPEGPSPLSSPDLQREGNMVTTPAGNRVDKVVYEDTVTDMYNALVEKAKRRGRAPKNARQKAAFLQKAREKALELFDGNLPEIR